MYVKKQRWKEVRRLNASYCRGKIRHTQLNRRIFVPSGEYRCEGIYGRTVCRMSHTSYISILHFSCVQLRGAQLLSVIRRHADTRFARIIRNERPRCLPLRFSFDGRNRARLSGLAITLRVANGTRTL